MKTTKTRRLRPLVAAHLADLPHTCRTCPMGNEVEFAHDPAWARGAEDRWGLCGVAAEHDENVIGYLVVTPALTLPKAHPLTHWSRTPDSAVLVSLRVVDDWAGLGVGKQLVQSVAARLAGNASCLEAVGTSGHATCVTPSIDWLDSVGFAPEGTTGVGPGGDELQRMQLNFSTTLRWRPDIRGAWQAVSGWVTRPVVAPPEPSGSRVLVRTTTTPDPS